MTNTRRSLILALVAGAFALLFIKSPAIFPGVEWIIKVLPFLVFGLSSWGLVLGIRSTKHEGGGLWPWVVTGLNGLVLIAFFLLVILLLEALRNFN